MRILMLTSQFGGRGGIQYTGRLILRALRQWAGCDAELTVLSVQDGPDDVAALDVSCTALAGGGSRLKSLWKAWRLLRHETWDLVVLGHLHLAPLLELAGHVELAPVIALLYGVEAWQHISGLRRRGLQNAEKLLYISQHTRRASETANPWLKRIPGDVCYLGLLPEDDLSSRSSPVAGGDLGRYAVAIGRMARAEGYKGFEELIRIWPRVERARPGTRLVLIGDGSDRQRLTSLAADLRASVEFTGSIGDEQRDELLRNCTAFCLPSRGEGFGLVYLEAMRLGKPVLAGSTDAGQEVVVNGVTGRVVSGLQADELLAGVLDVVGECGPAMGAAGRQRYHDHFAYSRFFERFTQHLESVVRSGSSTRRPVGAFPVG